MSLRHVPELACDAPGCTRVLRDALDLLRPLALALDWQRVYSLEGGIWIVRDYCPEHHLATNLSCVADHHVNFTPAPWDALQRRPTLCLCGKEIV